MEIPDVTTALERCSAGAVDQRGGPLVDRRIVARQRGEAVAGAYELSRGAEVIDVSRGYSRELRQALEELGCPMPHRPSADLVSRVSGEIRIAEVKSRGSWGPLSGVPERELETMRAAGGASWLYVVFNVTQPGPYELVVVNDPGHALQWVQTREAARTPDQPRGVRHEGAFDCSYEDIVSAGTVVDLAEVAGLPEKV